MPEVKIKNIVIQGMAVAIPENGVKTSDFHPKIQQDELQRWTKNHGILNRHVAKEEQTTSDLGYLAADAILQKFQIAKEEIGGVLVATSTPDYRSPATACVLQGRLGLSKDCTSFDLNLGDCGFIIGLQTASAILSTINKEYILLITGDTTSKQLDPTNTSSLFFGDGASAVLLKKAPDGGKAIIVKTGTASSAMNTIILAEGGFRDDAKKNDSGYLHFSEDLWWGVLKNSFFKEFTKFLREQEAIISRDDVIILPQMGNSIYAAVPDEVRQRVLKHHDVFEQYANTRGASIPLALVDLFGKVNDAGKVKVVTAALGEGISWGFAAFTVDKAAILPLIITDECFAEGHVDREI